MEAYIMLGTWIIEISYCRISTLNGELEKWKTTDCSSGRPMFYSQHLHGSSITPVPGDPILSFGLYGHCMNVVHRYKCSQNILTHKIVLKLKKSLWVWISDRALASSFSLCWVVKKKMVVAFGGDTNWTTKDRNDLIFSDIFTEVQNDLSLWSRAVVPQILQGIW